MSYPNTVVEDGEVEEEDGELGGRGGRRHNKDRERRDEAQFVARSNAHRSLDDRAKLEAMILGIEKATASDESEVLADTADA